MGASEMCRAPTLYLSCSSGCLSASAESERQRRSAIALWVLTCCCHWSFQIAVSCHAFLLGQLEQITDFLDVNDTSTKVLFLFIYLPGALLCCFLYI